MTQVVGRAKQNNTKRCGGMCVALAHIVSFEAESWSRFALNIGAVLAAQPGAPHRRRAARSSLPAAPPVRPRLALERRRRGASSVATLAAANLRREAPSAVASWVGGACVDRVSKDIEAPCGKGFEKSRSHVSPISNSSKSSTDDRPVADVEMDASPETLFDRPVAASEAQAKGLAAEPPSIPISSVPLGDPRCT